MLGARPQVRGTKQIHVLGQYIATTRKLLASHKLQCAIALMAEVGYAFCEYAD
jgi:hypothetical protein